MITVPSRFVPENYQQCAKSLMDNISDDSITFDENGISNYFFQYQDVASREEYLPQNRSENFLKQINQIKSSRKRGKYDCILGLSGGVDSSYLALLANEYSLRPLVVHFDYGWNTDMATANIEKITKKLNFELFTYVIDWSMMRDLQRSYYLASVVDIDVPADHTIVATIFKIAREKNIKYILNGGNYQTELIMPPGWNYTKTDLVNIKNIHKKFGEQPFKGVPTNGFFDQLNNWIAGYRNISLLNYVDYNKENIVSELEEKLDWRNYGGKHFENVFTRFYQGYTLLQKFGIDKRKAHLSNMIFSGQITKEQGLQELAKPTYDPKMQEEDKVYIAKKLGFTIQEFNTLLHQNPVRHQDYGTDKKNREKFYDLASFFLPAKFKKLLRAKL